MSQPAFPSGDLRAVPHAPRLLRPVSHVHRPVRIGAPLRLGTARVTRWAVEPGAFSIPLDADVRCVQLVVLRSGELRHPASGETYPVGSLLLVRGAASTLVEASMLSCLVSLAVPEAVLRDIGELPDTAPIVVSEPTMLTRGIVAFLAALVDGADAQASSIARHSLEQFMYEMVIALVLDRERARHASRRRDLFDEAQAVVLARSGDVALDVAMIAAECNVSPRTLERAYSARHTTVRGEIRRARVVHAGSMLRDAGYDVLSVDQIAQHVGFSNGSSLARAMRAEGQPSPATIRRDRRGPA